jgi:hypothetical protein
MAELAQPSTNKNKAANGHVASLANFLRNLQAMYFHWKDNWYFKKD